MNRHRPRDHWYDGAFYARVVDPWLEGVRREIRAMVEPGSVVLEVGCGTGALAAGLSPRCRRVVGVEKSYKMAEYARRRISRQGLSNVAIRQSDACDLAFDIRFDYAVASLVLHGVTDSERDDLLRTMRQAASCLLVADYPAGPRPLSERLRTGIPEFLAGPGHFRNYRSYVGRGGSTGLLTDHGLEIERHRRDPSGSYAILCARA